jgi:hypothetical protein
MERAASARADGTATTRGITSWLWCVLLLGLIAGHAWKTLHLFGAEDAWPRLLDQQPIVSGRHPLHLYHGYLGAQSFQTRHSFSCYDPAFDAGYPKTPVFDSGSRPAELALSMTGGVCDPAAYKVGLAVCWLLVPLLLVTACWGADLGAARTALATGAGLLVCWSTPARRAVDAGEVDLLLAALALLAHVGLLLRFDRQPGLLSWQGMLATACLGWFLHPLLFFALVPLLLAYYISIGVRHGLLTWHIALILCELAALAVNAIWLIDWLRYLWLRSPLPNGNNMLLHRTMQTVWEAPQWGDQVDRILGAVLLVSAVIGVALFNQTNQRVTARVLGLGAGGLWLLAILGIAWEPLGQVGTADLMVPAWWFAAPLAAHAWTQTFRLVGFLSGSSRRGTVVTAALLLALAVALARRELPETLAQRFTETTPLAIGLGEERLALIETLKQQTTEHARILWEDRRGRPEVPHWTALLPVLTGRCFIGGLDPNGEIEHGAAGLVNQSLRGRPLSQWSDTALEEYCQRYNIGWIACWSPEVVVRLQAWKGVVELAHMNDGGSVYLFAVSKAAHSFTLKGHATVLHMDSHHITLADVVPEDGMVVLSLHYQSGLQAAPTRVRVEPGQDAADLIPFVRLRMDRPVARMTITWRD